MAYPALDCSLSKFYPSCINALNEPLLNVNFLRIFRRSYVDEYKDHENGHFYLNPIQAPDELLKQFPQSK
jgi:hypothetical protein